MMFSAEVHGVCWGTAGWLTQHVAFLWWPIVEYSVTAVLTILAAVHHAAAFLFTDIAARDDIISRFIQTELFKLITPRHLFICLDYM